MYMVHFQTLGPLLAGPTIVITLMIALGQVFNIRLVVQAGLRVLLLIFHKPVIYIFVLQCNEH